MFWKKDFFELPKCRNGKEFIRVMTRLTTLWSSKSPDRNFCLKALMVMPSLLLLRTSNKAKTVENKTHLARRLEVWKERKANEVLHEGMTIQSRKKMYNKTTVSEEELSRKFSRLMMEGKLNAAIRLLEGSSPTVLPLTDYTMHCPQTKHPTAHVKFDNMLLQGFVNLVDKVIYDDISAVKVL